MTAINSYTGESLSIYPGEYHPLPFAVVATKGGARQLAKEEGRVVENIVESGDHYKIEITAPGHTKDDFMVTLDKDHLYVFATKHRSKDIDLLSPGSPQLNEEFLEHSVLLPANIDTDFLRAEYKDGVLSIWFPKTGKTILRMLHPVIVY